MNVSIYAILTIATTALTGCVTLGSSNSTQQPVQKIAYLSSGMTKQDVLRVMGAPARTEFAGSREAWHFCRTGESADEFAVVMIADGKVTAARNYTVTLADTGGATGDCSKFVRSAFR